MPEISVILPVYNADKYLQECLDSLLCQTFRDIEVLCINDGSTDKSAEILNQYTQKDNRVRVFEQENSGPAKARNVGLFNAKGQFLMFCDADDAYKPDMCEKMLTALKEHNVDLVMCDAEIIEYDKNHGRQEGNIAYHKLRHKGFYELTQDLRSRLNILLWNKIFKLDLIKKWHIDFPSGYKSDDDSFVSQYLCVAETFFGLDEKLYCYKLLSNSIMGTILSQGKTDSLFDKIYSLRHTLDFLTKNELLKKNLWILYRVLADITYPLSFLSYEDSLKYLKTFNEKCLIFFDVETLKDFKTLRQCKEGNYLRVIQRWCVKYKDQFRLYKRVEDEKDVAYLLLGFPIWKKRQTQKSKSYYLFGIKFYSKKRGLRHEK